MATDNIEFPPVLVRIIRVLDRPSFWMAYFIIGMYVFFFSIAVFRGFRKYNDTLDRIARKELVTDKDINQTLKDQGFMLTWPDKPSLKDYAKAGL